MPTSEDYKGQVPAWCPGCGNFQILSTIRQALAELGIEPWEVLMVSGIGQAGNCPTILNAIRLMGCMEEPCP